MSLDLRSMPPLSKVQRARAEALLSSWKVLNLNLADCDLAQVRQLLLCELQGKRRLPILERLCTRYSRLEAGENQQELYAALAGG